MEWLAVLLLVAAVVVPMVLLLGFAGCDYTPPRPGFQAVIVSATPLIPDSVAIKVKPGILSPVTFEAERKKGTGDAELFPAAVVEDDDEPGTFLFVDASLDRATQYTYRLRSVDTSDGTKSIFSEPATIETWGPVFSADLAQGGLNASVPGACIVQRLNPGTFTRIGNLIAVTVRAASDGDLVLSRVTISTPAPSGDAFDSEKAPIDHTPFPMIVSAGLDRPLPPAEFTVVASDPLLIAFDVGDPGNARLTGSVPHTAYIKQPPAGGQITEAGTADRSGFTEQPNILWLIEAIEVATKWPPIP